MMVMKKQSLFSSLQRFFLLVIIAVTGMSCLTLAYYSYQNYLNKSKQITDNYLNANKSLLQRNVQTIRTLAEAKIRNIDSKIEEEAFYRVQEAIDIAYEIYSANQEKYEIYTVQNLIRDALRGIHFYKGTGYYFIAGFQNDILVLYPPRPEAEGLPIEVLGGEWPPLAKTFSSIIKTYGDGFHRYSWPKINGSDRKYQKVSFVKRFAPYDWYIGAGLYIDDFESVLQDRIIEDVKTFNLNNNQFILFDNEKNILVGELDRASSHLSTFEPDQFHQFGNSLYYSETIDRFDWVISAKADLGVATQNIIKEKREVRRIVSVQLGLIITVSLLLGLLFFRLINIQNSKIQGDFDVFATAFRLAAKTNQNISAEEVNYSELVELSKTANSMIDENRLIKENLESSREVLSFVLNAVPSLIFILDAEGEIKSLNAAAEQFENIYSERHNNPINLLLEKLLISDELVLSVIKTRELMVYQMNDVEFDNRELTFDVRITPIGSLNEVVVQLEDTTDRVKLESMMVHTEKMMSVGGMAAGIAHEINNPLSIIGQAAANIDRRISQSMPANQKVAEDQRINLSQVYQYLDKREIPRFLNDIMSAVKRSSEIIANMLNFSATTASPRESCDIRQLIDEALLLAKNDYALKNNLRSTEIKIAADENMPRVFINKIEIEQVLLNLFKNAVQAMSCIDEEGKSPTLSIDVANEGSWVRVSVSDNGPGIDKNTKKRIFEPFFTTKGPGAGTGLGLSVSYFIITKRHGGLISVESEVGSGATFVIKLPIGVPGEQTA